MTKYILLQKIFAQLSFVTEVSIDKNQDQKIKKNIDSFEVESNQSEISLLSLSMQAGNEILKLVLEETNVKVDERQPNGDTCIHEACRIGVDMQILESLLI